MHILCKKIANFSRVTCSLNHFPIRMRLPVTNVYVVVSTRRYLCTNLIHITAEYVASKCLKALSILKVA